MSIENAQAFLNRLTADTDFRTQYVRAESDEERSQLVLGAGYAFDAEEIRSVLDLAAFQRSFSEDELEALTGVRSEIPSVDVALACAIVATGLGGTAT